MKTIKDLQSKLTELRVRLRAANTGRRLHSRRVTQLEAQLLVSQEKIRSLNVQVGKRENELEEHVDTIAQLRGALTASAKEVDKLYATTVPDADHIKALRELQETKEQLRKERDVSTALIALAKRLG